MSERHACPTSDWVDAVADQFEAAWQEGRPPSIARFLHGASGEARSALLHELVMIDLEYRWQAGDRCEEAAYLAEFPELLAPDGSVPEEIRLHVRRLHDRFLTKASGPESPTHKVLGKFQILQLLGRGAFGVVYKARDLQLDRIVAVKVPRADAFAGPQEAQRFLREARSAARLSHPHIVPVHEIAHEDGLPLIVSEYVEGQTLAEVLAVRRPGFREAAELTATLADALAYAHGRKIIHRDIKPQNILIDAHGRPHLTDFGLARREEGSVLVTLDGEVLGTPAYMAPEQAAGEQSRVDGRSDVYSLGVVLYEMLTGEVPFRGTIRMLLHQVIHDDPRPPRQLNDQVPRDLQTICLKSLGKDPNRRYATAGDFAADLRSFVKGEPIRARPVGRFERLTRWCQRNPLTSVLAAAVVLSLLAGTGVAAFFAVVAGREATRAQTNEADAYRRLYLAEMRLARTYWDSGRAAWVRDILSGLRPERTGGTDLRGFEWYYWHLLCHQPLTLEGQGEPVYGIAFSPDGQRLASGGGDGMVRMWDASSGRELHCVRGHTPLVQEVAFAADGRHLLTIGGDWTVRTWDGAVAVGRRVLGDGAGGLHAAAFSPDTERVATVGVPGTLGKVWDVSTGRLLQTFGGGGGGPFASVAFSPDGRRLAAPGEAQTVRIWDAATGMVQVVLEGHTRDVTSVAFSPKGQRLASGGFDGTVRVWDAETGRQQLLVESHTDRVQALTFSPDGRLVGSGGRDGVVRLWEVDGGRAYRTLTGHAAGVQRLTFSSDGKRLASSSNDGTIRVWDVTRPLEERRLSGHTGEVFAVACSPDGRWLASAAGAADRSKGEVKLWDLDSGQPVRDLHGHRRRVNGVTFSPDGQHLATVSEDSTARMWDVASGQLQRTFEGHTGQVWSVAFSPDGRRLATASEDRTVKVWDAGSGRELLTFTQHQAEVSGVAFSPDGRRLASASWGPSLKVWDPIDGRELFSFEGHQEAVWAVAWGCDGQLASVSNDQTVRLWDATSGRQTLLLRGHVGPVSGAAFSPDGTRLATASWDGTVRMWDVANGQETLTLPTQTRRAFGVAFSPDGRRLAAGCQDGTVRVWEAPKAP